MQHSNLRDVGNSGRPATAQFAGIHGGIPLLLQPGLLLCSLLLQLGLPGSLLCLLRLLGLTTQPGMMLCLLLAGLPVSMPHSPLVLLCWGIVPVDHLSAQLTGTAAADTHHC